MGVLSTAARSAVVFVGLATHGRLLQRHGRLGAIFAIQGAAYRLFRETEKLHTSGEPVVLVIGFRLKLIRSNRFMHWLFRRLCVLSTPFWCGLSGFKVKLWMADPVNKNYLGIYDWRGRARAQAYLDFLLPVLRFFSVRGSVWARQFPSTELEDYLATRLLATES